MMPSPLNATPLKSSQDQLWQSVNKLTKESGVPQQSCQLTPDQLNNYYAEISTDTEYVAPPIRHTACHPKPIVTEVMMFNALDLLRPTTEGNDHLSAWFLRLLAPICAISLTHLVNS